MQAENRKQEDGQPAMANTVNRRTGLNVVGQIVASAVVAARAAKRSDRKGPRVAAAVRSDDRFIEDSAWA